jgi:hypothetical protein
MPVVGVLGACAIGAASAGFAARLARKVPRPRSYWRPAAAGLATGGTTIVAMYIVVVTQPHDEWRVTALLIGLLAGAGVAYVLLPDLERWEIVVGDALIVGSVSAVGMLKTSFTAAIGALLISGLLGTIVGIFGVLIGTWWRPKDRSDHPELAEAHVVTRAPPS